MNIRHCAYQKGLPEFVLDRSWFALLAMVSIFSGCMAQDVDEANVVRLTPASVVQPMAVSRSFMLLYEGNSEGGSSLPQTTASFVLQRATIGGNISKSTASSASFIVSGGLGRGL